MDEKKCTGCGLCINAFAEGATTIEQREGDDFDEAATKPLLAELRANNLKSLTVVHMEVPCCFGLTHVAREAIDRSGANIPFEDVTIDLQGNISKSEIIGGRPLEADVGNHLCPSS